MILPPNLQAGDTVAIVATARKISLEELQPAIKIFENWGLKIFLPEGLFDFDHQLAGSDEHRTKIFQSVADSSLIKAIVCARGGYGTVKMVDALHWEKFIEYPKWVIGYSDVTVLHNHIHNHTGIATLHATMPINMQMGNAEKEEAQRSLKEVLWGSLPNYKLLPHPLTKAGNAQGIFVGGNISVLYSLLGSVSFPNTKGKILFLEDLDEYYYHLDRMMTGLKRAGILRDIAALVVGGVTDMRDNTIPFGKTAEEIIFDAVKEYSYPVYFGCSAGHVSKNLALPMGINAKINNRMLTFIKP